MIETQNMKLTKIALTVLALFATLVTAGTAAAAELANVTVTVEGKPLAMPVPPVIVDGRTLVGVRAIGEAVGGYVHWDPAKRQATVSRRGDVVVLTVGQLEASVNGQSVTLDVPPQIVDDRTMVPLRFIAESLGGTVEWNGTTRTANILRKPTAITSMRYVRDVGKSSLILTLSEPLNSVTPVKSDTPSVHLDLYPAVVQTPEPARVVYDSLIRSFVLQADGRTVRLSAHLWNTPAHKQIISDDGMTITLEFAHTITGVYAQMDGRIPVINIAATGKLNYSTLSLSSPSRLVVDLAGARLQPDVPGTVEVGQALVSRIRSAQFTPESVRVVLDMAKKHSAEVISTDLGLQLRFLPEIQEVKRTSLPGKTRLTFPFSLPVDATLKLSQENRQIQIEVPQSRSAVLTPTQTINDGTINTVMVGPGAAKGSTLITISLPYYLGHSLVSKPGDATVVLDLITSPVYGKRIWIDAGHGKIPGGKNDPGTIGTTYKTREADVNLAVSLELQKRLEGAGAVVFMTRIGDEGVDFNDRPALVNKQQPPVDLFVSVHHNSTTSSTIRGIETYYFTPQSKVAAETIHPQIVKALGFPDRKVRIETFVVVQKTKAPAVLLELGYLSNAAEEKAIAEPGVVNKTYPGKAAAGIVQGIFDYFTHQQRSAAQP